MHGLVFITFHEVWCPAIADKESFKFSMADTSEDCRVVDLVAIEMEDRKDSAVSDGIEELAVRSVSMLVNKCNNYTLLLCQLVARGPVSLSPSPTIVKAIRSGLSKTAPNACEIEYPSSPPS